MQIAWPSRLLILVGLGLLLAGCGRKTPPVPPGTLIPRPVKGFHAEITVNGVKLSWKVPVRHSDGSPIANLKGFELFRAELPPEESCNGCPVRFEHPIFIPYRGRVERDRVMIYEDRTVTTSHRYVYAVRAVKGIFNKSPMSRRIEVVWHAPPASPSGLKAVWEKGAVVLSWSPSTQYEDGTPMDRPVSYLLQRRRAGAEEWRTIATVEEDSYRDDRVETGILYGYRIVPTITHLGMEIQGPPTPEVRPSALDITPPAPPKGLVASLSSRGVELRWRANKEQDLAGYYVYRREAGGVVVRLNHRPITDPLFLDRTLLPPGTYSYSVTAVDRSVPENESPLAPWVSVSIESKKTRRGAE